VWCSRLPQADAEEEKKTVKGFVYWISAASDPLKRMHIGATLQTLGQCKSYYAYNHKTQTRTTSAHVIMDFPYWDVTVIEEYDLVGTREQALVELRQYKQQYLDIFKDNLVNKARAIGLDTEKARAKAKEYQEANKKAISARKKAYREANKKTIRASNKAYREANKEKRKAYVEANKDAISAKKKAYREANKEHIRAYSKSYLKKRKREC
jgi:hypothetical protein